MWRPAAADSGGVPPSQTGNAPATPLFLFWHPTKVSPKFRLVVRTSVGNHVIILNKKRRAWSFHTVLYTSCRNMVFGLEKSEARKETVNMLTSIV